MWFVMPEGTSGISVERQSFVPEIVGPDGTQYFRAPDHFAPRILEFKGFRQASDIPEGAPSDLPQEDPLRDGAIAQLTGTVEAQKDQIANIRQDLLAAQAKIHALNTENQGLRKVRDEYAQKISHLEDMVEDLEDKVKHLEPKPQ